VADHVKSKFILREIVRPGGIWYELIHDRFVEPILNANREWRLGQPLLRLAQKWINANRSYVYLLGERQLAEYTQENTNWKALGPLIVEYVEASQTAITERQDALRQRELEQERMLAEEQRLRAEEAENATIKQRKLSRIAFIVGGFAVIFAILAGINYQQAISEATRLARSLNTNQSLLATMEFQLNQQLLDTSVSDDATAVSMQLEQIYAKQTEVAIEQSLSSPDLVIEPTDQRPEPVATPATEAAPMTIELPTAAATIESPTEVPEEPTETPTAALADSIRGQDGVEMRLVPDGGFLMGSTSAEVEQAVSLCRLNPGGDSCAHSEFTSEMPQHSVFLSSFYMDVTEITNGQYKACVNAGGCNPPASGSGTYSRSNYYDRAQYTNYPVVNVTWFDARDYCAWVDERLPTEAEWEKAARGDDGRIFPWGNTFYSDRANTQDRGTELIQPVGQYSNGASPYGLLDMAGNVWEYVADWFDPDYYKNAPNEDPPGPNSSPTEQRVLRSGSYANYQHYARIANRGAVEPGTSTQFRGFRCVVEVTAVPP
jgi:formylglycine-generating enzyme required for sulfatase activity